jgi:hypothetical protein
MNNCLPVAAQREALLVVESKDGTEGQEHWEKNTANEHLQFSIRCVQYITTQKNAIIRNPNTGIC